MSCACQEIRAGHDEVPRSLKAPRKSHAAFLPAERKGYAGVGIYAKTEPRVVAGFGCKEFDDEGRYLEAHFKELTVISVYLPSGSAGSHRQASKFRFLESFLPHLADLRNRGREVVLCGDWNIAHREIDLTNWRSNRNRPGFLPEEREWLTRVFDELGFVDVFGGSTRGPNGTRGGRTAATPGRTTSDGESTTDRNARHSREGARRVHLHEPALLGPCAARDRLRLRACAREIRL
jgi:exodeoxyribonuclease III